MNDFCILPTNCQNPKIVKHQNVGHDVLKHQITADFFSIYLDVLVSTSAELLPTEHYFTWKQAMSIKHGLCPITILYNSFRCIKS